MFSADLGGYTAPPPAATDPPFQKVALLLHGDGTNGAQNNTFVDYSYPGGYAVSFDGSGDYLTIPSSSAFAFGTGDFTIEGWVNATSGILSSQQKGFFQTSDTAGGLKTSYGSGVLIGFGASATLGSASGSVWVGVAGGSYNGASIVATPANTITTSTWYHIAVVRSSGTVQIYVNGVMSGAGTASGNCTGTYCCIGGYYNTAYLHNGYISNLRIVKGTALYTSNFTPSNQPLTAVSGTSLLTCQSATIVDNSPNAFTITANGDAAAVSSKTITRTGNVAQGTFSPFSLAEGQWSNYFDGSGDYLSTPNVAGLRLGAGDFTVEAWINPSVVTSSSGRFICGTFGYVSSADTGWALSLGGTGTLRFFMTGITGFVATTDTIPINTWTHVAAVRSGTTITLYINGVSKATVTSSYDEQSSVVDFNVGTCRVDGFSPATGNSTVSITGYINNVRVVKGTALYTSNFTPSTTPLTAISGTSLLTCQSNRFKDNSSNNFTITRNGDTKVTAFSPFAPSAAYSAGTNGGSGYFDGSGDYLSSASASGFDIGSSDFTIEAFIYSQASTYNYPIVSRYTFTSGAGYGWILRVFNSTSLQFLRGDDIYLSATTTVPLNAWSHIAVSRSGSNLSIFLNGVRVASATGISNFADATTQLQVGRTNTISDNANGYTSNLRIVKGSAVYDPTQTTCTVPTAPLTAVSGTSLLLNCTNAGIIDNSGKNDIETVGNAQISTSVKKYGTGSMYFDGTGDWLALPASNNFNFGTGDFTVEFWLNTTFGNQAIVDQWVNGLGSYATGQWQIGMDVSTRYLNFYVATGASTFSNFSTSSAPTSGQWVHVAFVRSSNIIKFYIDGVANANTLSFSGVVGVANSKSSIGVQTNNGTLPFNGYIDDLRITKGQALYTSNFTPPTQAFPNS